MSLFRRWVRPTQSTGRSRRKNRVCPVIEGLESRVVLYSASGNAWPNPQVIAISFMPDGTNLSGGETSNLFASFNSNSSLDGKWQNIILQAAQTWAQETNINFIVVPDDGDPVGSGPDVQGRPGMGDIRIGGYNFGSSTLALTYQPPSANNFSIAGTMTFNTGQSFNASSTYNLFTVAMHEFGHALGLNESSVTNAVMYGSYTGEKTGLASDDIAGIRSIYSANEPRMPDAYNTNGASNGTLSTAASINPQINTSSLTALVPNLDISTAGQLEYFSFNAPSGTGSTVELDVQSSGLSLLSPEVTVYAANGSTVLASANGEGLYGTTLTLSLSGVTAGEQFYVKVQGADTTQMGTGNYALGLNFKGSTPPTEASPIVAEPDGNPERLSEGQADNSFDYGIGSPVILGISPDNGVSSSDGITNTGSICVYGSAPVTDIVTIYRDGTEVGTTIAAAGDTWTFNETSTVLSAGTYNFTAMATDLAGNNTPLSAPYQVVIDTHIPNPPLLDPISPETGSSGAVEYTNVDTPTFSGTTEPFAVVYLYANGSNEPFGATEADINGNWSFTVGQPGTVTDPSASPNIVNEILGTGLVGGLLDTVEGLLGGLLGLGGGSASTSTGPPSSLADGTYTITADVMDVAGNYSSMSSPLSMVVSTQPPPAPADLGVSPNTGTSTSNVVTTAHNLTISGTAQADNMVAVMLNGVLLGDTTSGSNGAWSYNNTAMTLPDGSYSVTAQATDIANNASPLSAGFNFTIETVSSPTIAGVSLTTTEVGLLSILGLGQTQQSLSVIGTAPAGDNVRVYLGSTWVGTATANGQGNWSYNYVPSSLTVANGTYSFSAVSVDASGNSSAPSAAFNLQVGGGLTASTPQYSSTTDTLSGEATPGSLVTIVDGDVVLGIVVASSTGVWQFTPSLSNGKNTIMIEVTNSAGYTSLLSSALNINV
jgi:Matrixin/Bacterial Ig-like domain